MYTKGPLLEKCQERMPWKGRSFLILLLLFGVAGSLSAQSIQLILKNTDLAKVVASLQEQAPQYRFSYQPEALEKIKLNEVYLKTSNLTAALQQLQKQYGLHYLLDGKNVSFKYLPVNDKTIPSPKKSPGKISGKIMDEENGDAIQNATIKINTITVISNLDGAFTVSLPKGTYTATVSHIGYRTKEITDIDVAENQPFELDITLQREKGSLAGVVVTYSAKKGGIASLYIRQKNNAAITDGISAEQIARTPDKNVGEVLKRISGLATMENKYVVVRGLSERYNQAILNGQVMPSTELNRKNFSFDIIPSNMVENVTVIKTLTPDYSAEFGGGLVEVNTLDIPAENFFHIGVGGSINSNTTNKNFRSLKLSGSEYWGKAASHRNLLGKTSWNNTDDAIAAYKNAGSDSKLFSNNWGLYEMKANPSQHYQLSMGRTMQLSEKRQFGVILALSYRNTLATQDIRMSRDGFEMGGNDTTERVGYIGKRYGFTTNMAGMFGLGFRSQRLRLSYQGLYMRVYDQQLLLGKGYFQGLALGYYDLTAQTDLFQHQLKGEYTLGKKGIKLKWMGAYTHLDRNKPDNHNFKADIIESDYLVTNNLNISAPQSSGISAGALRWWSRALEKNYSWDMAVSIPFRLNIGRVQTASIFKTGYAGWMKDRLFYVLNTGSVGYNTVDFPSVSKAFAPENGGKIEVGKFGDDFNKTARLHAFYGMFDNRIGRKWRLVWGGRAEYYNLNKMNMYLDRMYKELGEVYDYSELRKLEPNLRFFPSANLTYSLTKKMNLRLAYAKSIIRPDLREHSYFSEYDFELGGTYGSSLVRSTLLRHIDFRYEYYPGASEIISLSLFHKEFKYPMEIYKEGDNRSYKLQNNASATNIGLEVEVRKTLAFTNVPVIKNITLYGNFTMLDAKVVQGTYKTHSDETLKKVTMVEAIGKKEKRPQTGASNQLMNGGVSYDTKLLSVNLVYNYVANRMFRPADPYRESLFEQPLRALDAQVAFQFLQQKAELRISVSNLLDGYSVVYRNFYADGEITNGRKDPSRKDLLYDKGIDQIEYEARPGRTLSATFTYKF